MYYPSGQPYLLSNHCGTVNLSLEKWSHSLQKLHFPPFYLVFHSYRIKSKQNSRFHTLRREISPEQELETNMAVACQWCCHRFHINHFTRLDIKTFVGNRIELLLFGSVVDRVSRCQLVGKSFVFRD
ncbi:hypothetical protein CDAR_3861 [Caerostris darwini]|uniref:Uncharacterized protein n=1 Tax=Caerostris darwini TaxID=1538125 RepID=A0AAV4RI78_9ARAC|nr:hypothetical protein CDAR_3861 [Caerostris darwini]